MSDQRLKALAEREHWKEEWVKADAEIERLRSLGMGTGTDGIEATGWVKKINSLNAEVERLREGIQQALDAMSSYTNHRIYNSSWNILKELFE